MAPGGAVARAQAVVCFRPALQGLAAGRLPVYCLFEPMSTIRDDDAKMRTVERETMTLAQIKRKERIADALRSSHRDQLGIGDVLVFLFVAPVGLLAFAAFFYWLGTH